MDALREQVQTQTQKITQLEYENKSLKERLDGLRKARAATTKVVKAATQFSELKKKEIKLPLLVPAPKEDHNKCEAEIRSLKDKIEDMKDIHMMEVENYKNQIMDKIEGSKEMSADINRPVEIPFSDRESARGHWWVLPRRPLRSFEGDEAIHQRPLAMR